MDKVTRVSTDHNLFLRERRAEAVSNRGLSVYQSNALPLGQTGSQGAPQYANFFILLCSLWKIRVALPG